MDTFFITRMILLYQDINVPTFLLNQCIPDFLLLRKVAYLYCHHVFMHCVTYTSTAFSFGGLPGIL